MAHPILFYTLFDPLAIPPIGFNDPLPVIDLYCAHLVAILPGQQVSVDTGVGFEIPHHQIGLITTKSNLVHQRLLVAEARTIDSKDRKSVKIVLSNISTRTIELTRGDVIAQMIITTASSPVLTHKKTRVLSIDTL